MQTSGIVYFAYSESVNMHNVNERVFIQAKADFVFSPSCVTGKMYLYKDAFPPEGLSSVSILLYVFILHCALYSPVAL